MQQQLQLISAGAAAAHEKEISAGTDANELHVVPVGVVTNQPHMIAMAPHTEQKLSLLTIVGELAGQKGGSHQATPAAEHKLEQKMSLDASRADEQDMFAVKVMQKRKVVGCAAFSIAIAICFISAMSPNKKKQPAATQKKPEQPEEKPLRPTAQQSIVSEVSNHLADLADLIGKLKMPSEGSSELAKQAMETSKSQKIIITAEEPIPTVVA